MKKLQKLIAHFVNLALITIENLSFPFFRKYKFEFIDVSEVVSFDETSDNRLDKNQQNLSLWAEFYYFNQLHKIQDNKNRPLFLIIHGGGWTSRSGHMRYLCENLVDKGFHVLNLRYRFTPEVKFLSQVNDLVSALKWLQKNGTDYGVDLHRIYIWGYSAGAHLGYFLNRHFIINKDREFNKIEIKGLVLASMPSDLTQFSHSVLIENLIGASYFSESEKWKEASPLYCEREDLINKQKVQSSQNTLHEKKDLKNLFNAPDCPIVLIHGETDRIVSVKQSELFYETYLKKSENIHFIKIPEKGHFSVYFSSAKYIDLVLKYFKIKF